MYNEETKEILDYQFESEFLETLSLYYYTDKIEDDKGIEYNDDLGAYVIKYTDKTPFKNIAVATLSGDFIIKDILEV